MIMENYTRDITTLQSQATLWWPDTLKKQNAAISILPRLLETQDDFIALLQLNKSSPTQIFNLIKAANFPANLFLKHLCILSDYGGEPMQRLGKSFTHIFTKTDYTGKQVMNYLWRGNSYQYLFESMPVKSLSNAKLHIDGHGLQKNKPLDGLKRDMIMVLLHASTSNVSDQAGLDNCLIGSLLGDEVALQNYIRQRYIVVSRITGGSNANSMGQLAQNYVVEYLKQKLGNQLDIISNSSIKIETQHHKQTIPFDIVVSNPNKKVGIEVSFQVTTNSTIERKAGQAATRKMMIDEVGYKIAYIIDGAGNFQRSAAISSLCQNSDCTVAYSDQEFDVLVDFLRETLL
jgi:hypothetical protein